MAILDITMSSKVLFSNTKVKVIMPTGKLPEGEKFKVLYLLHGYSGDETDWMRFTNIELYSKKYNLAVIMPSVRNSFYQDMEIGDAFYTFISKELPETMEQMFPIRSDKEGKFVAGMSMGGYGAMHLALRNPYQFKKTAALSGAVDVEMMKPLWASGDSPLEHVGMEPKLYFKMFGENDVTGSDSDLKVLVDKNIDVLPDIYLACGTEDFLFEANQSFHAHLELRNVEHFYEETPDYAHTWDYWDLKIQEILDWMFEE